MKEPRCFLSHHPRMEATTDFVQRNNLTLARPIEEIVDRFNKARDEFMNFGSEVYIDFVPFDAVKPHMKPEALAKYESGEEKWDVNADIMDVAQDFLDYMNFAWGKAEDERGISASRSVQKLGAWLWILGRTDLEETINDDGLYNPYGAPALIAVCENLGLEVPQSLRDFAGVKC